MKAKIIVIVILLAHLAAIGTLLSTQGCQTPATRVSAPPPPVLPPMDEPPALMTKTRVLGVPAPVKIDAERAAKAEPITVEVQKGEVLSKIAARYGLTTRELADLNALPDPSKIRVGQKLIIPGYATRVESPKVPAKLKPVSTLARAPIAPVAGGAEYIVKAGDTLSHIAQAHKVRIADLKELNRLESDRIRAGQKLIIPASAVLPVVSPESAPGPTLVVPEAASSAPVPPEPAVSDGVELVPPAPVESSGTSSTFPYPVGEGDTVESIAKNFVVDPAVLIKLNPNIDPAKLVPGQRIQIPLVP